MYDAWLSAITSEWPHPTGTQQDIIEQHTPADLCHKTCVHAYSVLFYDKIHLYIQWQMTLKGSRTENSYDNLLHFQYSNFSENSVVVHVYSNVTI